uniref:Uncharacterized protein n=1 Tax=Anguilla anguilla TaxID=7936 RepID=A0A0E9S0S9_ANGAN
MYSRRPGLMSVTMKIFHFL